MPFETFTTHIHHPRDGQISKEVSSTNTTETTQLQSFKTILLGSRHGHDIRVRVPIRQDGTTVFDEGVRLKRHEIDELMCQVVSPGEWKTLPNYSYPVTILPGETTFFAMSEDAIGNSSRVARFYVLGDHYKNGIGQRVPTENAWSIKRDVFGNAVYDENGEIQKDEETVVFMNLTYIPYKPGILARRIIRTDSPNNEFVRIQEQYEVDKHKIVFFPAVGLLPEPSVRPEESFTALVAD